LDVLLDFTYWRMHLANQIVLGLRKLFDARCHVRKLFQHRAGATLWVLSLQRTILREAASTLRDK
jgi:hypothetical protein